MGCCHDPKPTSRCAGFAAHGRCASRAQKAWNRGSRNVCKLKCIYDIVEKRMQKVYIVIYIYIKFIFNSAWHVMFCDDLHASSCCPEPWAHSIVWRLPFSLWGSFFKWRCGFLHGPNEFLGDPSCFKCWLRKNSCGPSEEMPQNHGQVASRAETEGVECLCEDAEPSVFWTKQGWENQWNLCTLCVSKWP